MCEKEGESKEEKMARSSRLMEVTVSQTFSAEDPTELSVTSGASVILVEKTVSGPDGPTGWSLVRNPRSGAEGLVPSSYLDLESAVPVRGMALKRRLQRPRRLSSLSSKQAPLVGAPPSQTIAARAAPPATHGSAPAPLAFPPPSPSKPSREGGGRGGGGGGGRRSGMTTSASTGSLIDLFNNAPEPSAPPIIPASATTAPVEGGGAPNLSTSSPSLTPSASTGSLLDLFTNATAPTTAPTTVSMAASMPASTTTSTAASTAPIGGPVGFTTAPTASSTVSTVSTGNDMTEDDFFAALKG